MVDVHFLTDKRIARDIVALAGLERTDVVFEAGAGKGFLTKLLAARAHVIATETLEFDELQALGTEGASVIYGDALEEMSVHAFTKVVSNPPFTLLEPMLRALATKDFVVAVLVAPARFARKMKGDFFYSSLFTFQEAFPIPPRSFHPPPATSTVALVIRRKDDALSALVRDLSASRRKVKNFIIERLTRIGMTRREARRAADALAREGRLPEKKGRLLKAPEMKIVCKALLAREEGGS